MDNVHEALRFLLRQESLRTSDPAVCGMCSRHIANLVSDMSITTNKPLTSALASEVETVVETLEKEQ